MKRILVAAPLSPEDVLLLSKFADLRIAEADEVVPLMNDSSHRFHGMILPGLLPLSESDFAQMSGTEVIARFGAGLDNVDLEAATKYRIPIIHTPDSVTHSTAEHAIALIFALLKDLANQDRNLRAGNWAIRHESIGRDLQELVIGLIGFGRIGKRVAELLKPLSKTVIAYSPSLTANSAKAYMIERADSIKDLLPRIDVLSLHLPLTPATHHLIDRSAIRLLRPEAFLVNTSRGAIVDQSALVEALMARKLAGAALDVFYPEPPFENDPLLSLPNVILTPHRGSFTKEGLGRISRTIVEQMVTALSGDKPQYLANPEAWRSA